MKILIHTYEQEEIEGKTRLNRNRGIKLLFLLTILILICVWLSGLGFASEVIKEPSIAGYSLNQWCKAIYMAEGGVKTAHPYGILSSYKHTTPLEACRNTVLHKFNDWKCGGQRGAFLNYLGGKFCPVANDLTGLNRNWIKNVSYWLERL